MPYARYLPALAEVPYTLATISVGAGVIGQRSGLVLAMGLALITLR